MSARSATLSLKLATAKRSTGRLYRELLDHERLSAPELARLQEQRSTEMATFAFDHSSFYRDLYSSSGLRRDDLRDPEAFAHLPVIDRTMVKEHADSILTHLEGVQVEPSLTGGSTGQPLRTYNDARFPLVAVIWRMYRWWGIEPSDDTAHIASVASRKAQRAKTINWWPTRWDQINANLLEPRAMEEFIATVNKHRPRLVQGYVGALHEVASFARRRGLPLHSPHAVGATAAPLTAESRSYLESAWGAPVYDQYRSAEIPYMAAECGERDGLHVFSDLRRIEVVDEAGSPAEPGVIGEVLVSDLNNRVFPLLRYRLGDRTSLRERACACGRPFPLMEAPDGRTVDMIRLPDGSVLTGGLMGLFARAPDAVQQFQIHQAADFAITLKVVRGPSANAQTEVDEAAQVLRERCQGQVEVSVQYVDSLPYTGGKLKYVISEAAALD
jgi:phenylacetate-CoA ligase